MSGTRERQARWKRVGIYLKERREVLGLTQADVIHALGYKSRNAVSNIEVGIEGVPSKRAYAWADILEVPRDPFFRFVTGEAERVELHKAITRKGQRRASLSRRERAHRELPPAATEVSA